MENNLTIAKVAESVSEVYRVDELKRTKFMLTELRAAYPELGDAELVQALHVAIQMKIRVLH